MASWGRERVARLPCKPKTKGTLRIRRVCQAKSQRQSSLSGSPIKFLTRSIGCENGSSKGTNGG